MSQSKTIILLPLCFWLLSACTNGTDATKKAPLQPVASKTKDSTAERGSSHKSFGPTYLSKDSSIKLYTTGETNYLRFDSIRIEIPLDVDITADNIYSGIYEFASDSLTCHKVLVKHNRLYLTTFSDVGFGPRAYLYVFDIEHKWFIQDTAFKRYFLCSSAGIFVLGRNRIFAVDRSAAYQIKNEFIIPASLCDVKGKYFRYLKDVYKVGEEIPGDTSGLISFYKASLLSKSKNVFKLPNDWWKNSDGF